MAECFSFYSLQPEILRMILFQSPTPKVYGTLLLVCKAFSESLDVSKNGFGMPIKTQFYVNFLHL